MNKKIFIFALIFVIISSSFVSAGFWDWMNKITGRATDTNTKCYSDKDCSDMMCMAMPGQNTPKCNVNTGECYCGGVCGDGVCDSYEKSYNACSKDCQTNICSDGTEYGKCSSTKPKYCSRSSTGNYILTDRCSSCGCPSNGVCQNDGSCLICTEQYDPVCGADGKTYSNDCYAQKANVAIACQGTCPCKVCDTSDRESNKYCGTDGQWHIQKSTDTSCAYSYECVSNNCENSKCQIQCYALYDPVCGADGKTYSNDCYAQKANVAIECKGECPCETKKCSDGTEYGKCSKTQPLFCEEGKLVNKCFTCGCPAEQTCQSDGSCEIISEEAYFKFDYPPGPETFIFKLTDPEKIQEARDILAGRQTDATHVMGYVTGGAVSYNPPYDYHLDPKSINFFEYAMELCDAGIWDSYPEEYCSQYLPGQCTWCPWGSRLIKEVTEPQMQIEAIKCDTGCLDKNNNCLPIGTRTSTQYCDIDKKLKNQLSGDTLCNNNYECKTNFCLEGKCTEQGFFIRIINWFTKLFGG